MGLTEIQKHCRLDEAGDRLVKAAVQQLQLSARAYHRVLKLARTIADLDAQDHIQTSHLAEALQYRPKRRLLFSSWLSSLPLVNLRSDQYVALSSVR
jgi:magnesium chelatase family protein